MGPLPTAIRQFDLSRQRQARAAQHVVERALGPRATGGFELRGFELLSIGKQLVIGRGNCAAQGEWDTRRAEDNRPAGRTHKHSPS